MGMLEDIADDLAKDALAFEAKSGRDQVAEELAKTIGASSTTLEEAFMTAIRIRRAEMRARAQLKIMAQKTANDTASKPTSKPAGT